MDTKELKTNLKNAREALKNKEYKDVLRHCKAILTHEKNNYFALVFAGMAAEGLDHGEQVVKAYHKAAEADPSQPQAWQGLSSYFEKHPSPEHDKELIKVYQKLLEIFKSDKEKQKSVLLKLSSLYIKSGSIQEVATIYQEMIGSEEDKEKKFLLKQDLTKILVEQEFLSAELENKVIEFLPLCLQNPVPEFITDRVIQKHFNLLIKAGRYDMLAEQCNSIHTLCPTFTSPLEMILVNCCDLYPETNLEMLDTTMKKLTDLCENSQYLQIGHGLKALLSKKLSEAKDAWLSALETCHSVVSVHLCLARTYLLMGAKKNADEACRKVQKILQRKQEKIITIPVKDLEIKLNFAHAEIGYQIGTKISLEEALSKLNQLPETQEHKLLEGFIHLKMGHIEEAVKCVDKSPQPSALQGWIEYHKKNYQAAVDLLSAVNSTTRRSDYRLMLGKAQWQIWKLNKYKEHAEGCYVSFLKAAKLDPYCGEVFRYLGDFYTEVQNDVVKAKKCYQKAFDLDPDDDLTGAALCDALCATDREDEAHRILVTVTSTASAGSAKWAWLRLGLYQTKYDDPTVAVASFQSALRADPNDSHVWECLAEAYLHRGSLTAALKAFTKASDLSSSPLYSLFQIASIKQTLKMYTESIVDYNAILEISADYVPALKGLGETYLLLAKTNLKDCFHGRVIYNCQEALVHLTRAVSHRPDLSCLWKLMGDACTMVHTLDRNNFSMNVNSILVSKDSGENNLGGTTRINLIETLQLGGRCYGKALKCLSECSSLWHDLGVNLFHQTNLLLEEKEAKGCADKSINAFKKALSLDQKNHLHWNALGRVYCSQSVNMPDKAQHCFIKSIHMEANNVVAWTNLATLYFVNDNVQLAHEAFKIAQSLEPSYVACWIGQALIAETVGHSDAMDLFRHTNELANHGESAVGYAHWVCSMLLDTSKQNTELFNYSIKQMAACPAASDALSRYLDHVTTNPTAYNMYGLLLEHQSLYRSAIQAFQRCLKLLVDDDVRRIRDVKINLARVLSKHGEHRAALQSYEDIDNIGGLQTVEEHCEKANLLFKLHLYNDSLTEYEKAMKLTDSEEIKSQISVSEGIVLTKLQGLDSEVAKQELIDSTQKSPRNMDGLIAVCALALLNSDHTLTLAVLQELLDDPASDVIKVAEMVAACNIHFEGNLLDGIRSVQKYVHKYPQLAGVWKLMSTTLIQNCATKLTSMAARCAQTALVLDSNLHDGLKVLTMAQLVSGHHKSAMKSAQKAVHANPGDLSNWCNMVASCHGHMVINRLQKSKVADVINSYIKWIKRNDLPRELSKCKHWCMKHMVVHSLTCGTEDETSKLIKQFEEDGEWSGTMSDILSQDLSTLSQRLMEHNSDVMVMEMVLSLCDRDGFDLELDQVFGSVKQFGDSRRREFMTKVLKVYFLYKQLQKNKAPGDIDTDSYASFSSAVMDVLNMEEGCTVARILYGAVSFENNPRKAKYNFNQVLDENTGCTEVSIARRCLLHVLMKDKKEANTVKKLLQVAEEQNDQETMKFYNQFNSG